MSGYQVQTPGSFTASSIASPFNPIDNLQNEQIYNLQSFQKYAMGYQYALGAEEDPGAPGTTPGFVFLPFSCTNPDTPYELTLDQMVNTQLTLCSLAYPAAFPGGVFSTGLMRTYYVKFPIGFDATAFPVGNPYPNDKWVEYFQLIKGTFGFNQIPVGFNGFTPHLFIGQGTAICFCFPTPPDNPYANANGLWYFYVHTNPYDYAGGPLLYNLDAVTALDPAWSSTYGMDYVQGRYIKNNFEILYTYDYYLDLFFATFFPEEYNVPASKCPKAQFVEYGVGQQAWPQPL